LNGSRQAEEIFFNKYKKIIKEYIRGKFPKINSDDLDDSVSEILIKVFQCLNKYDSEKSGVKTWVLVITKHYLIDRWRSNSVSASTETYSIQTDSYITSTNANDFAYSSNMCCTTNGNDFENCSSINYISTQISPADFALLEMKYVQGYNYNEIGKEFNVTSSTISNRVNYIKTKLKRDYAEIIYD